MQMNNLILGSGPIKANWKYINSSVISLCLDLVEIFLFVHIK